MMNLLWRGSFLAATVGQPGSGKDMATDRMAEAHGIWRPSSSDKLREYITKHGLGDHSADNLNRISTELRRKLGSDFLIRLIFEECSTVSQMVISGIRTIGEAQLIRDHGGLIICIVADRRIRYDRCKEFRRRPGDDCTFDEFCEHETLETTSADPNAHNVGAVMAMADYCIPNNGTLAEFHEKVDALMAQIKPRT